MAFQVLYDLIPLLFLAVLWRVFNLRKINTAKDIFGLSTFGFYDFFGSPNFFQSSISQLPFAIPCCAVAGFLTSGQSIQQGIATGLKVP